MGTAGRPSRGDAAFVVSVVALAGVVVARFVVAEPEFDTGVLIVGSLIGAIGLQVLLLALRVSAPIRLMYAYLATPYFANRAFGEVWLGPAEEAGAGSFAPLLFGDAIFLLTYVFKPIRPPVVALVGVVLLAVPLTSAVMVDGFSVGAYSYQYIGLVRVVLVTWYFAAAFARPQPRLTRSDVVLHLGIIFGTMAALSGFAALWTGDRFGFPGWGANVYANALTVVGTLVAWHARGRLFVPLGFVVVACLFGIVGSGTRFALVLFVACLVVIALLRIVPRRLRSGVIALVVVSTGLVATLAPGWVLGPLGDVNPRLRTVGGVTFGGHTRLADVSTALTRESTVRTRLTLWEGSWSMFVDHPLGGIGWGQWNWRKAEHGIGFRALLDPHNGYVWWIAEGGVVALLVGATALVAWLARFRVTPFHLAILLVLVLELTNANVQKGLFGVLTAVLLGLTWTRTVVVRRPSGEVPPSVRD